MKTRKFVPLATIIGAFLIMILEAAISDFQVDSTKFTAVVYAGLGSSAAVGFASYWKRDKKLD